MKVLWITNIVFPEALSKLTGNSCFKSTGGWLLGAAKSLLIEDTVTLYVASITSKVKKLTEIRGESIIYFLIPLGKGDISYNREYEFYYKTINESVGPDIIHIHGTEYPHSLAALNACGSAKTVLSLQGIISEISKYYFGGIPLLDILKCYTLHDILKGGIIQGKTRMQRSGEYEVALIKKAKHIIGRTIWDKNKVWLLNKEAVYYHCNETLREEFYSGEKWDYNKCQKHSIFLSQGRVPIKGLHKVLSAMPLILAEYPDTTIRVAGTDITLNKGLSGIRHFTGYGKYIRTIINKYQLEDKVQFVGQLSADQMKNEYLSANVFVCPSIIENSPNSLGEAQILGTPCVASYAGGIPDLMKSNEDNLYRFEDSDMLAYKICGIFSLGSKQNDIREIASVRHNAELNSSALFHIYKRILKK